MEHFSTESVTERERFSYWREAVCDAYVHLGCEIEQSAGFQGEIKLRRYPNIAVSSVSGGAHDVYRRPQDIARADEEYFLLSLQTANAADITQYGRRAELKRGDCALYCSTDPYHLSLTDDFQQLVLQVRKSDLLSRLPEAGQLTGIRIDSTSEVGGLVSDSLVKFAQTIATADPSLQSFLGDTMLDLVATGLASLRPDCAREYARPDVQTLLRTKRFVEANLGNRALNRNLVASAMGLSVRRLNQIFAAENTSLSRFIKTARLNAVAGDLRAAQLADRTITELAISRGFENMQHFSKSFRDQYQMSPRDYRVNKAN